MPGVSVSAHLFGAATIQRDGEPVALPPASLALLARLLLTPGRPVQRQLLAETVGEGSEETVRKRLNTAVWRLRRHLEPVGTPREAVLSVGGTALSVTCEVWVDVVEFEGACRGAVDPRQWAPADADRVATGLELYVGVFLDGYDEDWALVERGRLADLHLAGLVRLAHWHRLRGESDQVVELARRAVGIEPLREDLHRLLMRGYVESGLPELAARQLEECRRVLRAELGIEPLPETVAAARIPHLPAPRGQDRIAHALSELERSEAELRRLAQLLSRSVQDLRIKQEQLRSTLEQ